MNSTYDEPPTPDPPPADGNPPSAGSTPPPEPGSDRRLLRTENDKIIGGVAGGIGRYFGFDPVLARIGFVAATALGGAGAVLYLAGWLLIPSDDGTSVLGDLADRPRRVDPALIAGLIALLIGLSILTDGWIDGEVIFGLALIGGGVYFLLNPERAKPAVDQPGATPPAPDFTPDQYTSSEYGASPEYGAAPTTPLAARPPYERPAAPPPPQFEPRVPKPKPPRSPLGLLTIGTLMLYAGVMVTASTADWFEVDRTAAWAGALGIVGAALVLSAWFGRARGLIGLGIILALITTASSFVNFEFYEGVGERTYTAASFDARNGDYELGAGQLVIDLGDLDLTEDRTLEADLSFGEMIITVPDDVNLEIDSTVRMGELEVLDDYDDGPNNDIDLTTGPETSPLDGITTPDPDLPTLTINAFVGFGRLEINR
ncbi:MAG: PspC domain-containing protein [Acidimicrobiales bacterium]|nr:PspC domain-containing protein [Acidimicrobiales bacterium]